ncbi:MAG: hypothetical protein DKT66_27700 [Candidatus Melainabacteria bacterium]|nr:MAG: hypothetical protein DKT66_27700 [Candidatus Melainabacteria bacterium]
MANYEAFESAAAEARNVGTASLSDYAMVRNTASTAQSDRQINDALVGNGLLPVLEFADGAGKERETAKGKDGNPREKDAAPKTDVAAPKANDAAPKAKDITSKEMKESGISANIQVDGATKTTNAKYPGGIDVSVSNGRKITADDGTELTITNMNMVSVRKPIHETKPGSGVFVDEKGRAVAKVNDDGTVTVDTGKGFYTQGPDGIKRVSALRSRNGKDFEVLNTDDPLGGMAPPDNLSHSKRRK